MKFEITESFTEKPMEGSNQRLDILRKAGLFSKYVWMLIALSILWFGLIAYGMSGSEQVWWPTWGLATFFAWVIAMLGEVRRVDRPKKALRNVFYLGLLTITLILSLLGVYISYDTSIIRYSLSALLIVSAVTAPLFYLAIHKNLEQKIAPLRPRGLTWAEALFGVVLIGIAFKDFSPDFTGDWGAYEQGLGKEIRAELTFIIVGTAIAVILFFIGWLLNRKQNH